MLTSSETAVAVARGMSSETNLLHAFRRALAEAAANMAAQGASPADIAAMSWTTATPAAIHPANRDVDLALREVFGGARPPLRLLAGAHEGVVVELHLRAPKAPGITPVYNGMTSAGLARAYSPRATVQNMGAIFDAWRENGAAYRQQHLTAELSYGTAREDTLDLYWPVGAPSAPPPLWIFIHGGYWQAVDKAHNAHFADGMRRAGFAVAMLNYTLAPPASLAAIVTQIQAAVAFLAREATALGCDAQALHIAGHSAGGHLAAMMACLPEGKLLRSCLPLSGLFDLEPLAHLPMGQLLQFDTAEAIAQYSPQRAPPLPHVRVGVAVGGTESSEFHRQSTTFAAAWGNAPCRIVAGQNHFTLLDGLNGGELLDFALEIARSSA